MSAEPGSSYPEALLNALVATAQSRRKPPPVRLTSSPLLAALKAAGTAHLYADTADTDEVRSWLMVQGGDLALELDGSTANQPLVEKVIERYLEQVEVAKHAGELRAAAGDLAPERMAHLLYAIVCARI